MARGRGRGRVGAPARSGGKKAPGRGRNVSPSTTAANAQANTEFDAPIREGREEVAGSRQRQADLGSWYAQLAADYAGAQKAGAAALGSVEATTTQQQAEASARSGTDQAALASEDQTLANLIGGPTDTAGLAKIAAAGAAAEQARVAQAAPISAEQANFVAQVGVDKAASRLGGIEARQAEGRRGEKIKSNVGALRREKGSARIVDKTKLVEGERTYATEQAQLELARREAGTAEQAAAASAALARLKANHEASQDRIDNRHANTADRQAQERIGVERSNAKISAVNAKTSRRSARATAKHYEKENSGALTTAEKRARGEHSADAMAAAKALLGIKVPKSEKEWSQFEAALIEKLGSSYAAQAATAVSKLRKVQTKKAARGYVKRLRSGKTKLPSF